MITDFADLGREAMTLIQRYAAKNDANTLSRLAVIPVKLQRLEAQQTEIAEEVDNIRNLFHMLSSSPGSANSLTTDHVSNQPSGHNYASKKGDRKKLRIEINWPQLGCGGKKEIICEHNASDSLILFVTRIYEKLGIERMERLSRFSINRGPFVTMRPEVDYRNGANGTLFQHGKIGDSGYWVLTHSDTSQKVNDIEVACYKSLGFPSGSVKVGAVSKSDFLADN